MTTNRALTVRGPIGTGPIDGEATTPTRWSSPALDPYEGEPLGILERDLAAAFE